MLRRYELTDDEWNRIADLLPPENTGKQGRPRKNNRTILNGMVWIARSGAPWRDLPERYGPWETVYSRFRKWINDGILDNIFLSTRKLFFSSLIISSECSAWKQSWKNCLWMHPLFRPTSIVQEQKKGASKRNRT